MALLTFGGRDAEDLSRTIKDWLTLLNADDHLKSSNIKWLTWQ
jgi:hypothetical protein